MKRFFLVPICGLLFNILACVQTGNTKSEITPEPEKTAEVEKKPVEFAEVWEEPAAIPEVWEEPVEFAEVWEEPVEIPEETPVETVRPVFQPVFYNLLVVDRIRSALYSDIGEQDGITMLYKFKHGRNGYLIAVYTSKEGVEIPTIPEGSRVLAIRTAIHKATIRGYVHSQGFRKYVTHSRVIPQILRVLEDARVRVIPALPNPNSGKIYRLQVGAFASPENAAKARQQLEDAGFETGLEQHGSLERVFAAEIRSADVYSAIQVLGAAGFREVWVRE
jgi:hypothetical protein